MLLFLYFVNQNPPSLSISSEIPSLVGRESKLSFWALRLLLPRGTRRCLHGKLHHCSTSACAVAAGCGYWAAGFDALQAGADGVPPGAMKIEMG